MCRFERARLNELHSSLTHAPSVLGQADGRHARQALSFDVKLLRSFLQPSCVGEPYILADKGAKTKRKQDSIRDLSFYLEKHDFGVHWPKIPPSGLQSPDLYGSHPAGLLKVDKQNGLKRKRYEIQFSPAARHTRKGWPTRPTGPRATTHHELARKKTSVHLSVKLDFEAAVGDGDIFSLG